MTRLLPLFVLLACGGSKAPPADAGSSAAAGPSTNAPTDSNSQAFLKRLLALQLTDFRPNDAAGAKFAYTSFDFEAGNTWTGPAYVEMDDERMDCTESGTWTLEPADSEETATVGWVVTKTNCAGREPGQATRASVTINGSGEASFSYR